MLSVVGAVRGGCLVGLLLSWRTGRSGDVGMGLLLSVAPSAVLCAGAGVGGVRRSRRSLAAVAVARARLLMVVKVWDRVSPGRHLVCMCVGRPLMRRMCSNLYLAMHVVLSLRAIVLDT